MKKIISLFQRNYDGDRLVRDEVVPGAEWVLAGEGTATEKYDGTACLVKDGQLYKRYDCKKGKTPPSGFIPAQSADPVTGHWPGWLSVQVTDPADKWFLKGWDALDERPDGTFECVGLKVQGNPYGLKGHYLWEHGKTLLTNCPRDFNGIRQFLESKSIEGIVWHHEDGRMVKIKRRDFGLPWPLADALMAERERTRKEEKNANS